MNASLTRLISDLARYASGWATIVLLLSITAPLVSKAAAEDANALGTLFYSPAERLVITRARSDSESAEVQATTRVQLDGLVKRGGGKSTVWLNGQPIPEGHSVAQQSAPTIGKAGIVIGGKSLRIGESLDLTTGERKDLLPQGALTTKKRSP